MKPFVVLVCVFTLSLLGFKLFQGNYKFALAGRIAMAAMLLFTAIGHFAFSEGMTMMMPRFIPVKKAVVQLTGILEIAAAIGLFVPDIRQLTGWFLIVFFILILPANIYAAIHQINYQKGTFDGNGSNYLWFRAPLQILFIGWVYCSTIYNNG